jgi:chemotaxis response regulator CheB
MRINVLLVDGRKLFREGLSPLLEKHADLKVVGEADDAAAAPKLVKALAPHVVILNAALSTRGAVKAIEAIVHVGGKDRPVLITGGCGFIGTNVAHRILAAAGVHFHQQVHGGLPEVRLHVSGDRYEPEDQAARLPGHVAAGPAQLGLARLLDRLGREARLRRCPCRTPPRVAAPVSSRPDCG